MGTEMQVDFNGNTELLKRCEKIRACASVTMGLAINIDQATTFWQQARDKGIGTAVFEMAQQRILTGHP
jgi:2-methylaconitate cis-trans-isomerase PrpF